MQNQYNRIENKDDVKLPLAYITRILNIAKFGTLASNETAPSTNVVVDRKRLDISIKKLHFITV